MKCHFIYNELLEPGGNVFLTGLQNNFESKGRYARKSENADIFMMNSYNKVDLLLKYKRKYPNHLFVHRIDGPLKGYGNIINWRDDIVRWVNLYIADATIFQSHWAQAENQRLKIVCTPLSTVIPNAPNPAIFNTLKRTIYTPIRKPRLISSNWSTNWRKGFETIDWLDKHLDFDRYDMTFVGKAPIAFKNIRHIQPVKSNDMASWLKQSDIYILAASRIEACSNALLEALHCGVPVIGVNSTSNPEFIGNGGELFEDPSEIPLKIEKILKKYAIYQRSIQNPRLAEIADHYYSFMESCEKERCNNTIKTLSRVQSIYLRCVVLAWKIMGTIEAMRRYERY
ncbi:MAG: glycosyltransferase family 4 protein [Candidatus Magnetomorum sp.]|nr:glycosyltransferase family 4 protein [Candidatus Magnetomorum sp.]